MTSTPPDVAKAVERLRWQSGARSNEYIADLETVLARLDELEADKVRLESELADSRAANGRYGDEGAYVALRDANARFLKAEANEARLLRMLMELISALSTMGEDTDLPARLDAGLRAAAALVKELDP